MANPNIPVPTNLDSGVLNTGELPEQSQAPIEERVQKTDRQVSIRRRTRERAKDQELFERYLAG